MALWTCRYAWTTRKALPTCPHAHMPTAEQQQTKKDFKPRFKVDPRLHRCQKPDSQNASRPGRHQIGMEGEIISESWARSNRNTRARSSESAGKGKGKGKGKAHRPYEFGVKVSVATTLSHAKGGQFVTHVKSMPGNPYDGHTLATVIPEMEALVGNTLDRILADKGYRGHNAPQDHKLRIFISGQKRGVTPMIKRQLRRRAAVEPVIGHLKAEHRMGRNYLWYRQGDAANAILAAVGYNFRRLIRWLRLLLCQILLALMATIQPAPA